ncbi:hypothetical protein K8T06_03780, partial [bacterium]|nr:hypothetical protein [bacterium]
MIKMVVYSELHSLGYLQEIATEFEIQIITINKILEFHEILVHDDLDLILIQITKESDNLFEFLSLVKKCCPNTPSIIISTDSNIKIAVRAMKHGASDYLYNPDIPDIVDAIKCVLLKICDEQNLETSKPNHLLESQPFLTTKMGALKRFAKVIVHDINNLITPILGYSEIVLMDLEPNSIFLESMTEIRSSAIEAKDLLNHLMNFCSKQRIHLLPVKPNILILKLKELILRTIHDNIQLELQLCSENPSIEGNYGQLEEIIMNLTINADKSMPDGGVLRLATEVV